MLRTQVLDRLVLTRVQTQRAQEVGIRVDDRELNEVLTGIAAQNKMTLPQFIEAVRKDGMDFPALREQIRDEVVIQRLRAREIEHRVLVTDQVGFEWVVFEVVDQENKVRLRFRLTHR